MGQTTFSGPVVSQNGFIENSFTTAQRDAIVNPTAGLLIYNTTTNTYQVYNGSTWQSAFTPAVPAPTVTGISPGSGSTAGGTAVTITGTNFTGATAVTIGGTAVTVFGVDNSTQISAVTAARSAGSGLSVLVTTPGGTNAANAFYTYAAATTYSIPAGDYSNVGLTFTGAVSNYLELYTPDWTNTAGYATLLGQTTGQVYTVFVPAIGGNITFTATDSWQAFGAGQYRMLGNVSAGGGTGTNVAGSITFS